MTTDIDLDFLKQQMDEATPAPDAARRAENLAVAMENFDRAQGSAAEPRQTQDRPKTGFLAGVWTMLTTRSAAALMGSTVLAAGLVVFIGPFGPPEESLLDLAPPSAQTRAGTEADRTDDGLIQPLPLEPPAASPPVTESEPEISEDMEQPQPSSTVSRPYSTEIGIGDTLAEIAERSSAEELTFGDTEEQAPATQPGLGVALSGSAEMGIIGGDASPRSGEFLQDDRVMQGPPTAPYGEQFPEADPNPLQVTLETPVSTFSIDVDTASYALLRSSLNRGQLPRSEAVRIEEMVNYFSYDYPAPGPEAEAPFEPSFTVFETPWNPDTQLVHIALQGEMPAARPPLNLVFLIDVSGSMDDPAKLPLLIQSFRLMLGELAPDDQVAIVTYAGQTGIALEPTPASERAAIEAALTDLRAGGSTNGQGGLEAAYRLAGEMSAEGEVSRVILATDGDFNVGLSDPSQLEAFIAEERESGTYLSVLGFGRGNLQDATMQALAQNGNGTAAYIDTLHEAQRVLVDQLSGALFPIADDVKVQIEFNPARVAEYRLIGYETRALAREDFNNDTVDAGELGAGHRVTAIYEITPVGSPAIRTDPLRYGDAEVLPSQAEARDQEIGFLRLRWKEPGEDQSQLIDFPVTETDAPSSEVLFATAIAGFGQILRGSEFLGGWSYGDAIDLANANRGADPFGLRTEAVQLMRLADSLDN